MPNELVDALLMGTYTEDTMRTVMTAIAARHANAHYAVRAAKQALSASAMVVALRRCAQSAIDVAVSVLLQPIEDA